MKIHGKEISFEREEVLVIPRQEGDIILRFRAVTDFEPFEGKYPRPIGKEVVNPKGDKFFVQAEPAKLQAWSMARAGYMIVKSLEATDGVEWSTIDTEDPTTYVNVLPELSKSFTDAEAAAIVNKARDICGLDSAKIEEATKHFLLTCAQEKARGAFTQRAEQDRTPSGEPVSV